MSYGERTFHQALLKHQQADVVKIHVQLPVTPQAGGTATDTRMGGMGLPQPAWRTFCLCSTTMGTTPHMFPRRRISFFLISKLIELQTPCTTTCSTLQVTFPPPRLQVRFTTLQPSFWRIPCLSMIAALCPLLSIPDNTISCPGH